MTRLKLDRYIGTVPVLGFNSEKYDINLAINEFMRELSKIGQISSIKNGNTYKSKTCGSMQFLDVRQYIPPDYNLAAYIKAYNGAGAQKSVFPYEFLDGYEKLDYDICLIQRNDFYSSLSNKGINDEEWTEFQLNIEKYNWKTLRDLLIYFNNLDVQPFLEAMILTREKFRYV